MRRLRFLQPRWPVSAGVGIATLIVLGASARAAAAPLRVGPGETYPTPCDAIAAAVPDDVIEIAAATYSDSCAIGVAGVTLRGVGGQPKIDLSGTDHPAQYKGIYVVGAADVTIENLELTGAHISADDGENAAAIRVEAAGLTVRACNIHDNQNGILGGTTGALTIEHTEFARNGLGDGCNGGGCTHNVYVANIDALYFTFNWSHTLATDTPDKGHLLKSRAKANYIDYNRITGEDGFDSYEIDLPNGGYAEIIGNVIEKGAASGNSTLLSWGAEGASNSEKNVLVAYNTFVNDADNGVFISAQGAQVTVADNLFVGPGTPLDVGAVSTDNLSGVDPLFVDREHYDYHLKEGSPAIGNAVEPIIGNAVEAVARYEYVHPLGSADRGSVEDIGAFEHGTRVPELDGGAPANPDAGGQAGRGAGAGGKGTAGTPVGSAGKGGSGGAASSSGGASAARDDDAGAKPPGKGHAVDGGAAMQGAESDGCGCSVPGSRGRPRFAAGVLCATLLLLGLRARGRRPTLRLAASVLLLACSGSTSGGGDDDENDDDAGDAMRSDAAPPSTTGHDAGHVTDAGHDRDASDDPEQPDAAPPNAGDALCPTLGWCELPDTHLEAVCPDAAEYPDIQANEGCGGVIDDWGGGAGDEARNRLLIWGGGHRGYFGNEVYALDLNARAMQRLTDPSDLAGVDVNDCDSPEAYADGRPSSRHTYDGLAYLPSRGAMFSLGGAGIPCGYAVTGTWLFDLGALTWNQMHPASYPAKTAYGVVADYDRNTDRVIGNDTYNLWSYDAENDGYTLLNDSDQTGAHIDYHMTGRVDPKRELFVIVGGGGSPEGGMQVFDIAADSDHAQQNWTEQVTGCDALLAATSPGFAYDPVQDRLIGWAGGDTVYVFDPDQKACAALEFAGGPGPQNENGTFGRFRYFPALGVFAVVNDYRTNAFVLRLTE